MMAVANSRRNVAKGVAAVTLQKLFRVWIVQQFRVSCGL
jgi:hypothetical protein